MTKGTTNGLPLSRNKKTCEALHPYRIEIRPYVFGVLSDHPVLTTALWIPTHYTLPHDCIVHGFQQIFDFVPGQTMFSQLYAALYSYDFPED